MCNVPAGYKLNVVEQLALLFTDSDDWTQTLKTCTEFFAKNIQPLPAAEIRHYLNADNNILPHILSKMLFKEDCKPSWNAVLQTGWPLMQKAFSDDDDQQSETSRDRRLFCKLLLLYDALLTDSAMALFKFVEAWCVQIAEDHMKGLHVIVGLVVAASYALEVFVRLLFETRKERHLRRMARMLGPLNRMRTAVFAFKQAFTQAYGPSSGVGEGLERFEEPLHRLWLAVSLVIERILAAAPAESVLDDAARDLLPYGCTVPQCSNRNPGMQISQFRSDSALRRVLSDLLSKRITFNREYVDAMVNGSDTSQQIVMFRASIMLICKLPEEKLRSIVAKDNLNSVLAIRRCVSEVNWYHVPKPLRVCFASGCGKHGMSFGECSACGVPEYCGAECQGNDWTEHKPICLRYRKRIEPKYVKS